MWLSLPLLQLALDSSGAGQSCWRVKSSVADAAVLTQKPSPLLFVPLVLLAIEQSGPLLLKRQGAPSAVAETPRLLRLPGARLRQGSAWELQGLA